MPKLHNCAARQYSDQMTCHKCGLVWDMNDPEPPECRLGERVPAVTPPTQQTVEPATANEGAPA